MRPQPQIGFNAAAAASGGGGGGELLTNGDFASGANWSLSGGVISGGTLSFAEGGQADQTLVGGSVPAGNYAGTIDISVNVGGITVILVGAGGENRGSQAFSGVTGTGLAVAITASGEVTKYRIQGGDDATTVDNVTLHAA